MQINKFFTVIPFLFLVACGGSNTGNNSDLSGIPQTEKEMRSFLKTVVEMSHTEILTQRQEIGSQDTEKTYPVYPIKVRLSDDGMGLIWDREFIGVGEPTKDKAMVEILSYLGYARPQNYCMTEAIEIMQKFDYYVVENLFNGDELIHSQTFDLARCQEFQQSGY